MNETESQKKLEFDVAAVNFSHKSLSETPATKFVQVLDNITGMEVGSITKFTLFTQREEQVTVPREISSAPSRY